MGDWNRKGSPPRRRSDYNSSGGGAKVANYDDSSWRKMSPVPTSSQYGNNAPQKPAYGNAPKNSVYGNAPKNNTPYGNAPNHGAANNYAGNPLVQQAVAPPIWRGAAQANSTRWPSEEYNGGGRGGPPNSRGGPPSSNRGVPADNGGYQSYQNNSHLGQFRPEFSNKWIDSCEFVFE